MHANGNIRRCSRSENPELFRLVVGGYGLFGIVASAKVNPYALKEAAFLCDLMLGKRPDVLEAMVKRKARGAARHFCSDPALFVRLDACR